MVIIKKHATNTNQTTTGKKAFSVAANEAEEKRKKARTSAKQQMALNNFMHGSHSVKLSSE